MYDLNAFFIWLEQMNKTIFKKQNEVFSILMVFLS